MPFEATEQLHAEIEAAGYYPQVAAGHIDMLLRGERVEASYVTTELNVTSIEGVQMELQMIVLTRSRLIMWSATEVAPADEGEESPDDAQGDSREVSSNLHTHSRVVPLSKVNDVRIHTRVKEPGKYKAGDLPDAVQLIVVMDMLDRASTLPSFEVDENGRPPVAASPAGFETSIAHDALYVTETQQASGPGKVGALLHLSQRMSELVAAR